MTTTHPSASGTRTSHGALRTGTVVAALFAVCLAQIGLAMPATLNGVFQQVLHPVGSELTWISDCSLLPITVLELTFGVLGDLFGRKRLLLGGAALLAVGEVISGTAAGVHQMWVGQIIAGLGCAALFPTSLAMLVAGLAGFVAMVLFVIITLDRPFRGAMAIPADSYQLVYDQLMKR